MKIRLLSFAVICAIVAFVRLQAEEAPNASNASKAKEEHTELAGHMEEMGKVFRRLGRQVGDASKNEDSLKLIATIREHAEAGLKLEPAKKAEVPAAQQAKFVADYQAKMKSFLGNIAKLESAIKAGNNAEAEDMIKALKQDQKEGHKEFKTDAKKS